MKKKKKKTFPTLTWTAGDEAGDDMAGIRLGSGESMFVNFYQHRIMCLCFSRENEGKCFVLLLLMTMTQGFVDILVLNLVPSGKAYFTFICFESVFTF